MKNLLFVLIFSIFSTSLFAQLPDYSISQEIDHSKERLSSNEIETLMSNKYANCNASTQCFNGRFIQCRTYGQGCTFYVRPGQYVQCTGYNQWGQWVNTVARCY